MNDCDEFTIKEGLSSPFLHIAIFPYELVFKSIHCTNIETLTSASHFQVPLLHAMNPILTCHHNIMRCHAASHAMSVAIECPVCNILVPRILVL